MNNKIYDDGLTTQQRYNRRHPEIHRLTVENWVKNHPERARAVRLLTNYKTEDKKANRGKGDLTSQWIVDNIFTQPCAHCGKTGWKIIGCNRLDNSKPHTMDNVEPCCEECNNELAHQEQRKIVYQYDKNSLELVTIWSCIMECGRNGYDIGHISECLNGKRFFHKNSMWSFNKMSKEELKNKIQLRYVRNRK